MAKVETEWREARGPPPRPRRGAVEARARTRALRTRDDGYTQCEKCGHLLDEREYNELVAQAEIKLALEDEAS
ncbi:hypothetical protein E1264_27395 [Actinomadura sp. KC216]|uniref:hypothetical protein n=1 Tax=Actinomadura sp. KC216 TaxID=2530370 RepID=UPI001048130F|nr:hypothetical protein [Actinomadura sp. KC216]TDB83699.1 hypothetical protein E1264_27395 [Actinomadura sp. KC216]